jgi:hypothetical protein
MDMLTGAGELGIAAGAFLMKMQTVPSGLQRFSVYT